MCEIKIGQELYYQGLGYGIKDKCWKIDIINGERYVHTNTGIIRKEIDVINNTCDLFSSKEEINKRLTRSYMSKFIE
jgi:hypothetical protein